jgi:peptidase A4-like protein
MQEPSRVHSSKILGLIILAAAAIIVPPSSEQSASPAPSLVAHGVIQPRRNDDGSLARGPRNEFATSNWSGYAVAKYQTGETYTGASATWTVPAVTYAPDASGSTEEYSSTWVGIGGFCENALCTHVDRTLIQLGTEQDVSSSGATQYYAWYEMLPKYPVQIPLSINPGDSITATLQCTNCSSKTQSWTLTMVNNSDLTQKPWTATFSYASSKLSAVWIEEAPYSGGVLPLADFGTVAIEPNSVNPPLELQTNGIQMTDPWGQTAIPSAVGTTTSGAPIFDVCWENGTKNAC